ncbi:uncharacterized protein BDR25DRAFT_343226 [Lindgomyces ingoldianus]|uniref:Uncharacterized protein n=1 Tax=Lindgomyces ingoldianus TaxID=673940 RepID=A0ACB6QSH3_9PLEO|nr:uncharacterized protein BDR25DRAFT_343226 [Lindgomyces ingoldianus]KAF2469933.1 hypothetical protein BDR25DRAFT_343226 [Lindgomyces ingoldianus]
MSAQDKFCPTTGQSHNCSVRIRPLTPTRIVRDEEEIICLEDTPESAKKGMFISSVRAASRTPAESARQQSIQRTSSLPVRGHTTAKLSILVILCFVQYEVINKRKRIDSIEQPHRTQIQLQNAPLTSHTEFVKNSLLKELVRFDSSITEGYSEPYLVADVGKDYVTHLPKSAEDYRTIKDLLESGYFKKGNQGTTLYLVYEATIVAQDEIFSYEPPTKQTKVKKEKKPAKGKRVKQESSSVKNEEDGEMLSYDRKRALSQLSDVDSQVPYQLRSIKK